MRRTKSQLPECFITLKVNNITYLALKRYLRPLLLFKLAETVPFSCFQITMESELENLVV